VVDVRLSCFILQEFPALSMGCLAAGVGAAEPRTAVGRAVKVPSLQTGQAIQAPSSR